MHIHEQQIAVSFVRLLFTVWKTFRTGVRSVIYVTAFMQGLQAVSEKINTVGLSFVLSGYYIAPIRTEMEIYLPRNQHLITSKSN
jgi:hypothetical protein